MKKQKYIRFIEGKMLKNIDNVRNDENKSKKERKTKDTKGWYVIDHLLPLMDVTLDVLKLDTLLLKFAAPWNMYPISKTLDVSKLEISPLNAFAR